MGFELVLRRVFQYIFIAFVAFHGLLIFLVQPFRSNNVRKVWTKWLYCLSCRHREKSGSSKSVQQPSSSLQSSHSVPATSAIRYRRKEGAMSSIARRFGFKAHRAGEPHITVNTHAENPVPLESMVHGNSEVLTPSYFSFTPNVNEARAEVPPQHSDSVLQTPRVFSTEPYPPALTRIREELEIPSEPSPPQYDSLSSLRQQARPPPQSRPLITDNTPHQPTSYQHRDQIDFPLFESTSQQPTQPSHSSCIPRSTRVGNGVRPEVPPRHHMTVSAPTMEIGRRGRPQPTPHRMTVGMIGNTPRPAPRTGIANRPLPRLPTSYVVENQHASESQC